MSQATDYWVDYYGDPVDPNGYGIDPASGDTIASLGMTPDASSYGIDPLTGDTIGNPGGGYSPDYFPDPGAASGGSITASSGGSGSGGSGFGTFLTSLAGAAGSFFRGAGIVGPSGAPQATGRTPAGVPCVLGTAGCGSAAAQGQQSAMIVLVAVGAIVLIVALRGK